MGVVQGDIGLGASMAVIHSAPFTAQTTVSSTTFAIGAWRRLEVHIKELGGLSTSVFVSCVGLTAGTYYTFGNLLDALTTASASAANGFKANTPEGVASLDMDIQIATDGSIRSATGIASMATAKGVAFTGVSTDTTHNVTGIIATFSTASSGYMEVIGHR